MSREIDSRHRIVLTGALALGLSACVRPGAEARPTPVPTPAAATIRPAPDTMHTRSADEAEVMRLVMRLFDGMRAGDSSIVRSAFMPGARLATVAVRNGVPTLVTSTVDDFARAVGTPHAEVWDERISHEVIQIDGPLATVWMRYRFFVGSRFSHCGVNAFELFRGSQGWRISSIADTRRQTGCE